MSDLIELTETTRLRVEIDDTPPRNPREDWDSMMTGFVKMKNLGDLRQPLGEARARPPGTERCARGELDDTFWRMDADRQRAFINALNNHR